MTATATAVVIKKKVCIIVDPPKKVLMLPASDVQRLTACFA